MAHKQINFFGNQVASSLLIAVSVASPSLAYQGRYFASPEAAQTNPWYRPADTDLVEHHVSLVEMVSELKQNGFPIAAIAQFAGVERKTIYSWLDGSATPKSDREDRVTAIYPVLKDRFDGDFLLMHRVWRSKTRDGVSLETLFAQVHVDQAAVKKQLAFLDSSIENIKRTEARRKTKPFTSATGRNAFVEESPIADFERI